MKIKRKTVIVMVICFLLGFGTRIPSTNDMFIPIVSAGGDCPTTEAELEGALTDVSNVYTNNDITANVQFNSGIFNYIDKPEIVEPATPAANTLRLFVMDEDGFSRYYYKDEHGVVRTFNDDEIIVKNVRGTTIAQHRLVYVTGASGGIPTVDLANASDINKMPAIGVTIESIANNGFGRVMQVGLLTNVNTNSYNVGTIYVSDTTAGIPTNTPPITPSFTQEIGNILVKDAVVGKIQIISRALTGDEFGTVNNFTITENCSANFITAKSFFGDGGNLTNITADGDGFAGWIGHPHNQDLNTSSNIQGLTFLVSDYIAHVGDADTVFEFLTDKFKFTMGGAAFFELTEAATETAKFSGTDEVYYEVESTGAESNCGYKLDNDDSIFSIKIIPLATDKLYITDEVANIYPFVIESGATQNAQIYLDNSGYVDIAGGAPNYRLELPNTAGNAGRGNSNRWDVYSDQRFKFDFSKLPRDETLTLCRLISWRIYRPIETWQDFNGTIYKGNITDGFSVGAYAQALYWDIVNAFGNNSRAYKIANNIVTIPDDESVNYWGVSYDVISRIYNRGWQFLDQDIQFIYDYLDLPRD